jgi:hypothetical protein
MIEDLAAKRQSQNNRQEKQANCQHPISAQQVTLPERRIGKPFNKIGIGDVS